MTVQVMCISIVSQRLFAHLSDLLEILVSWEFFFTVNHRIDEKSL